MSPSEALRAEAQRLRSVAGQIGYRYVTTLDKAIYFEEAADFLDEYDAKNCTHLNTGRVKKFDGGKCPLLCGRCYTIVGTWRTD